ncbi:MAG TPA: hypothetical protein VL361_29100 [Candidatus Limnocylindrales bacterium]|nr:hypothetical protein [Candidatus Limnocylindrales bacterium]
MKLRLFSAAGRGATSRANSNPRYRRIQPPTGTSITFIHIN